VAEYGIAALIAGGLAAKAGLFKVLLGALIALKKFIVLGLVAAAAFLRRLFGASRPTRRRSPEGHQAKKKAGGRACTPHSGGTARVRTQSSSRS